MPTPIARTRPVRAQRAVALLSPEDFERHLVMHATAIASSDVTALVARGNEIRGRLTGERHVHPRLAERATIALRLLDDHAHGECPQIPYHTVSLLTTALLYYLAPMDVIPDFIPRAGTADDALVLDIAWRLAAPGVQRYLDWKDFTAEVMRPVRRTRPRAVKPRPKPARTRRR